VDGIRKLARILSGFWLVGILVLGAGGAWLSSNPDTVANSALSAAGFDADELRTVEARHKVQKAAQRKAREYEGGGWGAEAAGSVAPGGKSDDSDWGASR